MSERLNRALEKIDAFNRQDPRRETAHGQSHPVELLYSQRLTEWVLRLNPQASEALRAAARGQHIGRWTIPRDTYPMDRGGYLRWREDLKKFHAQKTGEILKEAGYDEDFIQRVKTIISKRELRQDPETQTLEDALCLVFLETQFMDFREKTDDEKLKTIVRKTWAKMSPKGHEAALSLKLPPEALQFLQSVLSEKP